MKTNILFIAMLTLGLSTFQAQAQTTVYAKNSDISDNLDLRAVASIFGESSNLQDFERRLNDPKYQISNLDLNDDNDVDYLRVIESVENRTHVVIIQAVLDRDVYQDIATIDVERDNYNKVSVQVVGNTYLYGANYIYEPVYHVTPSIYASFWVTNYRPYYSTWAWNFYPTYYYTWRPFPVYRYRNNINVCINVNNNYNYVNHRRSYRAPAIYETRRSYGYERMRPNNSFSQRHSNVSNRYDLDQRRVASRDVNRNNNGYNNSNSNRGNNNRITTPENRSSNRNFENKSNSDRGNNNRVATPENKGNNRNFENKSNSDRSNNSNRVASSRENVNNNNTPVRVENQQRTESRRNSNDNNMNSSRQNSESRNYSNRSETPQRTEAPKNYAENRGNSSSRNNSQREQAAPSAPRQETQRMAPESRGNQGSREAGSPSRGGGRRG